MTSNLLQGLKNGWEVIRSSSRFLLVGILIFVFPLLFIWVSQLFYSTAYDNIHEAENLRVGMIHDTLSAVLKNAPADRALLNNTIMAIVAENDDVTKLRVYMESPNGMLVVASEDSDLLKTYDPNAESIRERAFSNTYDFHRTEYIIEGKRTWQAYKRISIENVYYYIFSEQDFSKVDAEMTYRQQQSYLVLSVIFVFLMALAYWLSRQINWQKRYYSLAHTLHERDLFTNMIAHEFRSPLTAIKGYASFLEESTTLIPDERRFVGNIKLSAEHLVALVSDFLEVARLQSGKLKIEKQSVDVRTVLYTVVENLQGMATEKNLQLEFDPLPNPIMLYTDPTRLQQILVNLVTNSIKYTQTGSIRLRCTQEYQQVTIRVMDTGMGISAEDQQKLFAPFTRVGGVDSGMISGTGLGMYITKQLVTLLGGTIGVESIKEVGSHVVVSFDQTKAR